MVPVLDGVGRGAVLVGLARCFGVAMGPAFHAPLLARGIADWWRRYNTHFRDLLVHLFWYPVVLRLRRRPILAGYAGCAAVFLAGSLPLHWPKAAVLSGTPWSFPWGVAAECAVMTALVGTSLALERRRRARVAARPAGAVRAWAQRVLTAALIFATVAGVGYQVDYRLRDQPWRELVPPRDAPAAEAQRRQLERLVRERPRAPERRRALARALELTGDLAGAERERELAHEFAAQTP